LISKFDFSRTNQKIWSFLKREAPIIAILLLALYIRLVFPGSVVTGDDSKYAKYAYTAISENSINFESFNTAIRVGLYLPVGLAYLLFGVSDASTLIYPLLVSLMGITFIYLIGSLIESSSAGLLAALLWALLPTNYELSTLLLPDGLVAAFSVGAIYFLLLAEKQSNSKASISYLLCFGFAAWTILIKITGIVTAGFIFVRVLHGQLKKRLPVGFFRTRISQNHLAFFVATIIAFLIVMPDSLLSRLDKTSSDVYQTIFIGRNPFSKGSSTDFDAVIFLAIISIAGLSISKNKNAPFLFSWFMVQYLYFEWGPQLNLPLVRNLSYDPLTHFIGTRTILFLLPPLILFISIFLAEKTKPKKLKGYVLGLSLLLILFLWVNNAQFQDRVPLLFPQATLAVLFLGSLLSPLFIFNTGSRVQNFTIYFLIGMIGFSSIRVAESFPFNRPEHKELASNLDQAAEFLLKSDPKFSIFTQYEI